MITMQQLIDKIRLILTERDPNNSFLQDPDIVATINEVVNPFSRDIQLPKKNIPLSTVAQQTEYAMPVNVLDVIRVFYKTRLRYIDYDDYLIGLDMNIAPTYYATPDEYYLREEVDSVTNDSLLMIGFNPTPSEVITITANVVYKPDDLSDIVTTLPYPSSCFHALVYRIMVEIFLADRKYDVAATFQNMYEIESSKIRMFLSSRVIDYVNTDGGN
jgi:hypothetical protein